MRYQEDCDKKGKFKKLFAAAVIDTLSVQM